MIEKDGVKLTYIAARAERIAGLANAAYWAADIDENRARYLENQADDAFRLLANVMGYRVERIADGINTGTPQVAGGI